MENIIILPNHFHALFAKLRIQLARKKKGFLSKNLFSIHFLPKTFRKQLKNLVKLIHGLKKHKK
jgi:hypothetical protein